MKKPNVVILASGNGTNFEALARELGNAATFFLICNKAEAGAFARAKKFGVSSELVARSVGETREAYDERLALAVAGHVPSLVVLAGFMHKLSRRYFEVLSQQQKNLVTINLHPAHREDYRGAHAYNFATENKFPRWGLSVHVAVEELDAGPLLAGREFEIFPWESTANLQARIRPLEHQLLVSTVKSQLGIT